MQVSHQCGFNREVGRTYRQIQMKQITAKSQLNIFKQGQTPLNIQDYGLYIQ